MNLSIWHCFVLYCCLDVGIEKLAEKSDLSIDLLNQTKIIDKWDTRKSQFAKLTPKQKVSLEVLELLFGEFQSDVRKKSFVERIIEKIKNFKKSVKPKKAEIKLQKINQLAEFGISHEQATAFIEEVEKTVIPDELSIQDKLDIINNSYKDLVSGYNSQLANRQKILEDAIKFYAEEIAAFDFDEIAVRQRTLSCNAQSLSRLIKLYIENFSS